MRILCKNDDRDYYDGVAGSSGDRALIYDRKRTAEKIDTGDGRADPLVHLGRFGKAFMAMPGRLDFGWCSNMDTQILVGFCGRMYPLYEISDQFFDDPMAFKEAVDLEQVNPIASYGRNPEVVIKELKKRLEDNEKRRASMWGGLPFNAWGWNQWEAEFGDRALGDDLFVKYDAPILMLSIFHGQITFSVNPSLGKLGFSKRVNAREAYQELSMYLANNMVEQFDPTHGRTSDEIRDAHGFDGGSFRQGAPGQKKEKRRANKARKRGNHEAK